MKKSLKVFLACFLGGGIGTLTALQINGIFWWLGLLVGGFVGYLTYEIKQVGWAIKKAWKMIVRWRITKEHRFICKEIFLSFLAGLTFVTTIVILSLSGCIAAGIAAGAKVSSEGLYSLPILDIIFSFLIGLCLITPVESKRVIKARRFMIIKLNPIAVFCWYVPKGLIIALFWLAKTIVRTPKFIPKIVKFIKMVFILIHSEVRLLCGIDAAIGATIGYFAGSVIIGALAGGVFGLLNYEIISVRILHLNAFKIKNT